MNSLVDSGLSKEEEARLLLNELDRRKGLEDHYYFSKFHLKYADCRPKPHQEVSKFLQDPSKKKKKLVMLPRGAFKSSHVTMSYPLWRLAKNPDLRILIDNEVYGNARSFLREMKGNIDRPEFLELYPELTPNKRATEGWTENSVILKARTKELKEPSISCAGVDQIKVGMHYDIIVMDDLVSPRNITTPEQIAKVIDHYRFALSLLEPDGELIVIGTRYHYNDLYGYIEENESEFFDIMIRAAIDEYGELLFPERLTLEFLRQQRASQGSYIYNCQYMLRPVDEEGADFKRDWLIKYRGKLVERGGKRILRVEWNDLAEFQQKGPYEFPVDLFALMDPASKKKKKTDWTVIIILAVHQLRNDWYILDMIRDKLNPKERVEAIFYMYKRWKFNKIGIETVGFQDTIKFYCVEKMRETGTFFRIQEVSTGNKAKRDRILSLQPKFENGSIYLPKAIKYQDYTKRTGNLIEVFEDEYSYFPVAKTDDIMDTLAYGNLVVPQKKTIHSRRQGKSRIIGSGGTRRNPNEG